MAESRFKGLSILMNMRDVGIERTMKQIRAQFKTLDSEMRRSNANFKHSEKNMQSYATRTKELTKAIDVTENSMKDISNQLKKMTLEEQRSSVEAEKLRQEYSKQHRALQMYQRQLNSTEQEMKQFGTTTKQTIFSMKKINAKFKPQDSIDLKSKENKKRFTAMMLVCAMFAICWIAYIQWETTIASFTQSINISMSQYSVYGQ